MADEPKEIQCIDWHRCFAFLEILRSFRMAIHPVKLFLCLVGLAASFGAGVLVDQISGIGQTDVHVAGMNSLEYRLASLGLMASESRTSFYDNVHFIAAKSLWGNWAMAQMSGRSVGESLAFVASPLYAAKDCVELAIAYWRQAPWFALVTTVLMLIIWGLIGGAVTRITAVRFAREEGVPMKKALGFAVSKWPSTATCMLIPFGVLVLMAIGVGALAGLPLMIPYGGEIVEGVFFFLALIVGVLLALIFIGGTFSLGLQWPTIAVEGSDSFDAISRSISYISSRPWRYLFYTGFSAAYGCLTFVFVKFVTYLTLAITHKTINIFSFGKLEMMWPAPSLDNLCPRLTENLPYAEPVAQYFYAFWVWILLGLMAAFLVSFFFTSQTVIYFLLRKIVDATDIEEVYMEESDEEPLPLGQQPAETAKGGAEAPGAGPAAAPPAT
jgi:hypothetical protein